MEDIVAEKRGRQSEVAGLGHNSSSLELVEVAKLRRKPDDPSRYSKAETERAKPFVARFQDRPLPIVVGTNSEVLCGGIFVEAARASGIRHLRVIRQNGLDELEEQIYGIATSKLLSAISWDGEAMERALRSFEKQVEDFASNLLGFAPGELDKLIGLSHPISEAIDSPTGAEHVVSALGSLWRLNNHRVGCFDSTEPEMLKRMTGQRPASAAICDFPFGCPVDGFVSKRGKHADSEVIAPGIPR